MAITLLVPPMYPPHYQLLLAPAGLLLVWNWRNLWASNSVWRILLVAAAAPLIWQWGSALALAIASFFTPRAQEFWQLPLWTSVVLPIPVIAGVGRLTYRRPATAH